MADPTPHRCIRVDDDLWGRFLGSARRRNTNASELLRKMMTQVVEADERRAE